MPVTLPALIVFVVFLAPACCYVWRRERLEPRGAVSPTRELASLVLVSVACVAGALLLFAVVRAALPGATPDVGRLIANPGGYFEDEYRLVTAWFLPVLAAACLFAVAAAGRPRWLLARLPARLAPRRVGQTDPSRVDFRRVAPTSMWWDAFELYPDCRPWVQCHLEDGTYLAGFLFRYSTSTVETADRDLILAPPVECRRSGDTEIAWLETAVVVSARRVLFIGVAYLDAQTHSADALRGSLPRRHDAA